MRDPLLTRSRDQIDADNRAEIDGWIDERTAELIATGVEPAAARRRALDEFGDVAEAQQYGVRQDVEADRRIRVALWAEEFAADVRIALRTLSRSPLVTAVVLLTFALGIGAATAVFSVVHAMLLRPLPYGDEHTLVQLQPIENGVLAPAARYSASMIVGLSERTTSFTSIAAIDSGNIVLTGNGDPEQLNVSAFTPNSFAVLRIGAAIGRTFSADGPPIPTATANANTPATATATATATVKTNADVSRSPARVVILLDGLWRRRFGADPNIVGRTIELNNGRYEVIGVMPPGFRVPTYEAVELLMPRDLSPLLRSPDNARVRFSRLFARLKPGVSRDAAQADVDRAMRAMQQEDPRAHAGIDTRLTPIRMAVAGDARPRLLVLMGAAAFVLMIACANVAGILLARAIARRHELSVRMALGAGRRRLIRQFLAEGAVLAAFGTGLGLLIADRGIVVLQRIAASALPAGTQFALEPRVVLFAIAAAVTAALAASLIPALGATRTANSAALRRDDGRMSPSRASRRLRLGLVAAQLAVSVVLLAGAGLFLRTYHGLTELDLGYATDRAVTFRLPFTRQRSNPEQDVFWTSLYEQLRGIPGVVSVGGGNIPITGQSTVIGLEIEGRVIEKSRLPDVRYTPASDDYFAALGIPVIRGRVFNAADRDGSPAVAVVSAGLARQLWPNADPIGARVKVEPSKPWFTIVGIVGDVRMGGGADAPRPSIYTSQRQDHWPGGGAVVVRAAGAPASIASPGSRGVDASRGSDSSLAMLAASIRERVKIVDPTLPIVGLRTLEESRINTPVLAERLLQMRLMLAFALVALIVSAIGVYGVSAYATEARRREFGIRMALGASSGGVLWLVLREGAQVATLGALAGVPIAVALAATFRDLLYGVAPFDPLTLGAVLITLAAVVSAASILPARRATLIDPARTMRTD